MTSHVFFVRQEEDLIFLGWEDFVYQTRAACLEFFFLTLPVQDGVEKLLWHSALSWQFHSYLLILSGKYSFVEILEEVMSTSPQVRMTKYPQAAVLCFSFSVSASGLAKHCRRHNGPDGCLVLKFKF